MCVRVFSTLLVLAAAAFFFTGCGGAGLLNVERKDKKLFMEAQHALDVNDFPGAIELFQTFMNEHPRSEQYSWALHRLGESFEGLLQTYYVSETEEGADEKSARTKFLSRFGEYDCWQETAEGLVYDGSHYRRLLKEFPDSPIADESAYRLVPRTPDRQPDPEPHIEEIGRLEQVLERYPTTTLRYEILYRMAHRCHVLYGLYAFSGASAIRSHSKAEQYRAKALYLYKLALKAPSHSFYSTKAWEGLRALEGGRPVPRAR